jgi:hypothetical protein
MKFMKFSSQNMHLKFMKFMKFIRSSQMVIPDGHPLRVPSLFRVARLGSAHAQWSGAGRICQKISFGPKNLPFFEDF